MCIAGINLPSIFHTIHLLAKIQQSHLNNFPVKSRMQFISISISIVSISKTECRLCNLSFALSLSGYLVSLQRLKNQGLKNTHFAVVVVVCVCVCCCCCCCVFWGFFVFLFSCVCVFCVCVFFFFFFLGGGGGGGIYKVQACQNLDTLLKFQHNTFFLYFISLLTKYKKKQTRNKKHSEFCIWEN